MAVPYYTGYMAAVVDDGKSIQVTEPTKVYSPQQAEMAKKADERFGSASRDYGTMSDLPHILVGSTTFGGDLAGFQMSVANQVSEFRTGQLKELEQVFRQTTPFEVLPTSR